jgi:hypothetical protein
MEWRRMACWVSVVLGAFALPLMARAQFEDATPDELKMTADPQAPGAAAVYLYREEFVDDYTHTFGYYFRIKVLTEKGKELATVHMPYVHGVDSVVDIQGRTIHADGSILLLTAKPSDLMDIKAGAFQINNVVFTLPDVETGSILEYRIKFSAPAWRVSEPSWEVQSAYFTHKVHFLFHPSMDAGLYLPDGKGGSLDRLMTASRLGPNATVAFDKQKHIYTLDLADVPPVPDEDWMPPLNTLRWRVEFYYTNAKTGPQFWADMGKDWAQTVEEFTNPNGGIKKAAAQLVDASDTDEQKARKIYAAVQKMDNTVFSRKKSEAERKKEKIKEIHKAEDVWKQQSGSDDEITLLYVSLARAAGLKAHAVQVVDRDRAMFDAQKLTAKQLDDYIVMIEIDGKEVYLDPGQKMCPFGTLHWKHTLASGFGLKDKTTMSVLTPPASYKNDMVQRFADLDIDAGGGVKGTVRYTMAGPDALYWRQLTLENDQDEVKKRFKESLDDAFPDGVTPEFDHFDGLDDANANLVAVMKVSGNMGASTGKHFFLPGNFFESRAKHPFVAEDKRSTPIDVHYPKIVQDDVTYHLPSGLTLESTPQGLTASWPEHALLKISSQTTAGTVNVKRTLAYNYTILDPAVYPTLHDFYQKVAAADQQQLVLTRAPAAAGKGN